MTQPVVFPGAMATHQLVGRTEQLALIHQGVFPGEGRSFQCLILQADGGKGKTRLLREVEDRLSVPIDGWPNRQRGIWQHDDVVVLPLIDLGDIAIHTVTGFLREVRLRFADRVSIHAEDFRRFNQAWLDYETARDGQADFNEVYERTQAVVKAFEEDYQGLTAQRRVVWVLDTFEQLFAVPSEIAMLLDATEVESKDLGLTTYNWLLAFLARKPANTTVLLAGRPEPGHWLKEVTEALEAVDQRLCDVRVTDFTLEETQTYLQYLHDQLKANPETATVAAHLHVATDEREEQQGLHLLTGGNPIRLALYIDLFVNADSLPDPFRHLKDVQNQPAEQIGKLQSQLDQELLKYLASQLTQPEPQVLEYLSVMRRGLDRARLKYLWGSADDEEIEAVFKSLQRFSFIKERYNTLFLHDEFYRIYQQSLIQLSLEQQKIERERQQDIFDRLMTFCEQRANELTEVIHANQAQFLSVSVHEPAYLEIKDVIRDLRAERLSVRAERIHYGLYRNPNEGLNNLYFRVAGQAFLASEQWLDDLLQAEINIFFFGGNAALNCQQTGLSEAEWEVLRFQVLHERVSRWIRRLMQVAKVRDKVEAVTSYAQQHHRDLVRQAQIDIESFYAQPVAPLIVDLFHKEWDACRCFAALFEGSRARAAVRDLDAISEQFEAVLRQDRQTQGLLSTALPAFKWRLLNILAECLLFAGFGYANLYDFKTAEQRYRRAALILERTGFRTLQAEVQNDLSRVLGELGALHQALTRCQEGMAVRDAYGFDYLSGLSNNTMSLIYTRNARPTPALYYAGKALNLFRQINNPRGIGLALLQIAETKRRIWKLTAEEAQHDPLSRTKIDRDLLEEVEPFLEEAEEIFRDQSPSDTRLVEVWNERGCLYRDWVALFGCSEAKAQFDRAEQLFDQAMDRAHEHGYRQHYLSSYINKAWLYGRSQAREKAAAMVERISEVVDQGYMFSMEQPVNPYRATNVVNFRELSKLSSLAATVLLADSDDLEAMLREHIFAITYLQLFSSYDPFYLGVTKRQLSRLIGRSFARKEDVKLLAHKIIAAYHLRESVAVPLQAELVINEVLNSGDVPDYLD